MAVGSVGNSVINLTPGALTGVDAGASSSIESDVSDQLKNFQTLKDPAATGPEVAAVQGLLQKQIATLSASSDPKDQATAKSMQAAMPANGAAASSYKDIQGAVKAFQDGEGLTKPGQPPDGVVGQQTFAGLLGVKDDAKFGFGGTGATKTSPTIAADSAAAFDKIATAKAKLTPTVAAGTNGQSSFAAGGSAGATQLTGASATTTPVDVNTASLLNTKLIDVAKLQQGDPTQAAMAHKIIQTATDAASSAPAMKPDDFLKLSQALKTNPGNVTVGAYYQGEAFKAANPDVANAIASAGGASPTASTAKATTSNGADSGDVSVGLQRVANAMKQQLNYAGNRRTGGEGLAVSTAGQYTPGQQVGSVSATIEGSMPYGNGNMDISRVSSAWSKSMPDQVQLLAQLPAGTDDKGGLYGPGMGTPLFKVVGSINVSTAQLAEAAHNPQLASSLASQAIQAAGGQ